MKFYKNYIHDNNKTTLKIPLIEEPNLFAIHKENFSFLLEGYFITIFKNRHFHNQLSIAENKNTNTENNILKL